MVDLALLGGWNGGEIVAIRFGVESLVDVAAIGIVVVVRPPVE